MRKYSFLLLLGILVFITPFIGLPESWKAIYLFVLGASIVVTAFTYRFVNRKEACAQQEDFFSESEPATHPVGDL